MSETKKAEVSWSLYFRVISYLRGRLWLFALSIFGFVIFGSSQPMLAKMMELVIESIEQKNPDGRWLLPLMAVGIFVLRGIGTFIGNYYNARVGGDIVRQLKLEAFGRLIHVPASFYDSNSQGELLHNLNTSVSRIQNTVTGALKTAIREGITIIALLGYIFYLNWKLSLVFLVIAPILALLVNIAGKRFRGFARKNEQALGKAMQVSKEMIGNYGLVRAFGAQDYEKARYRSAVNSAFKTQMKIRKVSAIFTPLTQLLVACAVAVIIFLLLTPSITEGHTAGDLIGYLTAVALLPKSIRQLSGIGVAIQRGLVSAEMVFGLIDAEPEKDEGDYEVDRARGEIEFRNLTFYYPNSSEPALRNINCTIKPGEMVALVGHSGGGKSTLASLIYRRYDVEDGMVFLDGVDINQYKLVNLRKQLSVVDQNVTLFDDTIKNNIAYGDVDYSDAEIDAAVENAHVKEFVEKLPKGLETAVGENGVLLSGGQRQRVSIARAFLKSAPVLIMDEATSALDNESEAVVTQALEELAKEKTTLVIAHRLSTILQADRLLVLKDGEIVEQGTHQALLAQGGVYAALYEADYANTTG